jgi:hypothetical protein
MGANDFETCPRCRGTEVDPDPNEWPRDGEAVVRQKHCSHLRLDREQNPCALISEVKRSLSLLQGHS